MASFLKKLGNAVKGVVKGVSMDNVKKVFSKDSKDVWKDLGNRANNGFNVGTKFEATQNPTAFSDTVDALSGTLGATAVENTIAELYVNNKPKIYIGLGIVTLGLSYWFFKGRKGKVKPLTLRK